MKKYKLLIERYNYIVYIKQDHLEFVGFTLTIFVLLLLASLYSGKIGLIYSGLIVFFSALIILFSQMRIMYLSELKFNSEIIEKYLRDIFFIPENDRMFCCIEKGLFSNNRKILEVKNYISIRENKDVNFENYLHELNLNNINPNLDKSENYYLNNYLLNSTSKRIKETRDELRNYLISSNSFSNKRNIYKLKYFSYE